MSDGRIPYDLVLCDGHTVDSGYCSECRVWWDRLLERGIALQVDDSNLHVALRYHQQSEWRTRDLKEIALDIDDGTDDTNYTWIIAVQVEECAPVKWFAVRGWHDCTGWDCQSGLRSEPYESKEAAFRTLVDWERDVVERKEKVS